LFYVALTIILMTLWFREGDAGIMHNARSMVQAATAPVSAAGELITRPVRGLFTWAGDLGVSRSQLEQLRDQNEKMRTRVAQLEEARLENVRLRKLVKLTQASDLDTIGAHVIGRPTNAWEGVITIDRGSADGVTVGMPVIGNLGLLGQTVQVSRNTARVRLITDQRSGVASMIQRTRVEGVVSGSLDGRLSLEYVSTETTVRVGDVVISSGQGGVFPKGLLIGEVTKVARSASMLQQDIRVEPASDPSKLEEVLVLVGAPPAVNLQGGE